MHKTFITPLDREDIYALANKMDNVLDMIENAAVIMYLYKVKTLVSEIVELASSLNSSIGEIKTVINLMKNYKKNVTAIKETCIKINSLENEADDILHKSMARLFEQEKNPAELIKWKEILERLEEATDMCEDVSNVVEGIVLKHG